MQIKPLRDDLLKYLKKHNLEKKFDKTKELFEKDPFYPSLNTELLEPKDRLIYSFRLDKKYRAIFIYVKKDTIEIIAFTNHYRWIFRIYVLSFMLNLIIKFPVFFDWLG